MAVAAALSPAARSAWIVDSGVRLLRAAHPEEMELHVAYLRDADAQKRQLLAQGSIDPYAPYNIETPSVWGGTRYVTEYPDQDAGRSSAAGFPADAAGFPCITIAPRALGGSTIITAAVARHAAAFPDWEAHILENLRTVTATRSAEVLIVDRSVLHAGAGSALHAIVRAQTASALVDVLGEIAHMSGRPAAHWPQCPAHPASIARVFMDRSLNGVVAAALLLVGEIAGPALPAQLLAPAFDFVCGADWCSHQRCAQRRSLLGANDPLLAQRDYVVYALSHTATLEAILAMVEQRAGPGPIEQATDTLFEHGTVLRDALRDADTTIGFYQRHFESLPYFTATMLAARFLASREAADDTARKRALLVHHLADEFAADARHALAIEFDLATGASTTRGFRDAIAQRARRSGSAVAQSLVQKWLRTDHRFPAFWEAYLRGADEAAPFWSKPDAPFVD